MTKVVHLISSLRRGGRERQLSVILNQNIEVCQNFAIVFNNAPDSFEGEYTISHKLFFLNSKNPIRRLKEIISIIRKVKPDIIWSWGGFEASFGLLISLITTVIHINGSIRHGVVSFRAKQIWRFIILHFSKNIVANSKAGLKANCLKRGHVLYNGLDNSFFQSVNKDVFLRENLNIKQSKDNGITVIISVANLVPYKDYYTVLESLFKLKKTGIKFLYIIIGEGPCRSGIERFINEKKLNENIVMLGRRAEIKEFLSVSDVFVHSSKGEGCSNAILEAMAGGLPIIATDKGGTNELVSDNNGRLFRYKDSDNLYKILVELLSNKSKLVTMGNESLLVVKNRFTLDVMIQNYCNIIGAIKSPLA